LYSIIDIESNGGGFREEIIIEIAIYRFDGHKIVDQFSSLINPEADITNFVQRLTRISPKMVKTAPKFHEVAKRVIEITEGTTLVGHNIEFDYRMLRQSFKRLGYDFKIDTLDTIDLAKKLIPEAESFSLGKLVKSLGIPLVEHHRARGDARATLDLFKVLISKDTENEIIQKQHEETNAKTYVNKIKELTQDLPNAIGIVYFQDEKGEILFSDFVDNINKFSKKLFNSKSQKYSGIQEKTQQIHYELAGTPVLAKLLMITKKIRKKQLLPYGLYHRKGKYLAEKTSLHPNEIPLLKFSSFTQAMKVLQFLREKEIYQNPEHLTLVISLKDRNELWSIAGRTLGEKAFLILKNGKLASYGFYELHTQIQNKAKLQQLKIDVPSVPEHLTNELKLLLIKEDVQILPLPES